MTVGPLGCPKAVAEQNNIEEPTLAESGEPNEATETAPVEETQKKKAELASEVHRAQAQEQVSVEPVKPDPITAEQQEAKSEQGVTAGEGSANVSPATLDREQWMEIYPQLPLSGIAANVLANSDFIDSDGANIYFVLSEDQSAVYSTDLLPKLSRMLSEYFNVELTAHIEIGETKNETPAMRGQRLKQERHTEMVNEFEQDENVQQLLKHFSGTLAKESIAPLKD